MLNADAISKEPDNMVGINGISSNFVQEAEKKTTLLESAPAPRQVVRIGQDFFVSPLLRCCSLPYLHVLFFLFYFICYIFNVVGGYADRLGVAEEKIE